MIGVRVEIARSSLPNQVRGKEKLGDILHDGKSWTFSLQVSLFSPKLRLKRFRFGGIREEKPCSRHSVKEEED